MGKMLDQSFSDIELNLMFDIATKEEHIESIINLRDIGDNIDDQIAIYEAKYKSSFELDSKRYMYAYLKHINDRQAINLYDSLLDSEKEVFIEVIKIDHLHLVELVDIHEEILFHMADVFSKIIQ